MDVAILKQRREKLGNLLNNGEIVIIFAAEEQKGIAKYLQNNNFLYLTGLYETPEAVFVCQKQKDTIHETLYIQRNIPEMIVWDGAKLYPDEAKEISGILNVKYVDEFDESILHPLQISTKAFVNTGLNSLRKPPNKELYFVSRVRNRVLDISFAEANQLMAQLRQIKDDSEIDFLSKAIEITGIGLSSIFTNAAVGMYEYELEALLFYEMKKRGLDNFGFAPIIAAGINATTLHYKKNNTMISEDELVLCDCGALYQNYSADITRTFPIAGTFSQRQKAVYSEVLNVQKTIICMIKPGVSMIELNQKANELIGESCVRLGLITDTAECKKYYMHSIGHQLGMDTHDLGSRDSVLLPGMVITIEPGIYIKEEGIGVRIEDDILVTEDGYHNLSHMIPKEIDEIETLRNR